LSVFVSSSELQWFCSEMPSLPSST